MAKGNVTLKDVLGIAGVLAPKSSADLKPQTGNVAANQIKGTRGFGERLMDSDDAAAKSLKTICSEMNDDKSRDWTCALALGEVEDRLDKAEGQINKEFATFDEKANRKRKLSKDEQNAYKKAISRHRARAAKMRLLIWAVRNGHWTGLEQFTFDTILSLAGELRRKERGVSADVSDSDREPTDKQMETTLSMIDRANPVQTLALFDSILRNVVGKGGHMDAHAVKAAQTALAILGKTYAKNDMEVQAVKEAEQLAKAA